MKMLTGIPVPLFLLLAALLEVSGDAAIRKALFHHQGAARMGLFVGGVGLLALYGTTLNLAPLEFGQVVGLYVAILFLVWQAIAYLSFGTFPGLPILLGGGLIVSGGLMVSFWKGA